MGMRRRDETDLVRGTSGIPVTPVLRDFPVSFSPNLLYMPSTETKKAHAHLKTE